MRVGFLVTLSDQIERYEPILRRTPGARFLVAAGRWPSPHRDSRAEIIRRLEEGGLAPVISPRAEFDLVVAGSECPENSVAAWLRERGTRVLWQEPDAPPSFRSAALTLCAGTAARPSDPASLVEVVGDPLLDPVHDPCTRARARTRLGLLPRGGRPVLLLHAEAGERAIEQMSWQLASLRLDFDLLVSASEQCRLEVARALPEALGGPAIHRLPAEFPRAEAIAASDLVLAEPGVLLAQAAAARRPVLALGRRDARRGPGELELPLEPVLRAARWLEDPHRLRLAVDWLMGGQREYVEELAELALAVVGSLDGMATTRAVQALQLLAAGHPEESAAATI